MYVARHKYVVSPAGKPKKDRLKAVSFSVCRSTGHTTPADNSATSHRSLVPTEIDAPDQAKLAGTQAEPRCLCGRSMRAGCLVRASTSVKSTSRKAVS